MIIITKVRWESSLFYPAVGVSLSEVERKRIENEMKSYISEEEEEEEDFMLTNSNEMCLLNGPV